jgi:hypothetical protein
MCGTLPSLSLHIFTVWCFGMGTLLPSASLSLINLITDEMYITPLLKISFSCCCLLQAESSRQMYRAVMEQVVRFLERAYKNLDLIKNKMDPGGSSNKSNPSRFGRN